MPNDFGPESLEVNPSTPDPGAAQDRIDAFEREHAAVLVDPNHPGRGSLIKERSKLYAAAFPEADPNAALDVEPGDTVGGINRVLERYGALGEDAQAFAGELAAAGISAAEMAGIAEQVAGSNPMSDAELVNNVSRDDLRAAAGFLEAHPEVDELLYAHDLHRFPVVLRIGTAPPRSEVKTMAEETEVNEVTDEHIEAYIRRKSAEMAAQKASAQRSAQHKSVTELSKGGIFSAMWTFWQDSLLQIRDPKGKTTHARLVEVADTDNGRMAELAVVASTDASYRDVVGVTHMSWPPTDGTKIRVLRSA